ncbi:MAG: hypothetical protein ACR2F1_07985 [Nitrososphaeraceae archaeon]
MDHELTQEEYDILINNYNRWECDICKAKVGVEMNGADNGYKIGKLRDHVNKHGYPYIDPNNESINDFWPYRGESIQKPRVRFG